MGNKKIQRNTIARMIRRAMERENNRVSFAENGEKAG